MRNVKSAMDEWNIEKSSFEDVADLIASRDRPGRRVKVVCFDYFDTLAVRIVLPEYTKVLASSVLSWLLNVGKSGEQIYAMRREMERALCESNNAAGRDMEFDLSDLARRLYERLGQTSSASEGFDRSCERFIETVLSIELAVECAVQRACRPVVELLKALHQRGLTTVVVSDFYLPAKTFQRMLRFHGFEKHIDHLYVSADYGETKGSGRLYRRILEDTGFRAEQVLMIGDNPHADIRMAAERNLQTLRVENPSQSAFYRKWEKQQHNSPKRTVFATDERRGDLFPEMGTTLWLFTCRLFQELRKHGVRDVFFFSKEGEFLKRLFDDFQQRLFAGPVIHSHYLVASRKATFIASLRPLEQEDFSRLFDHYRDISLRDFMLSLNMPEEESRRICVAAGLDFERRFSDLASQECFSRLLKDPFFREAYRKLREQQKDGFLTYLNSFGVDYRREGLFIVDVGWKGSIQDNIFHILEGEVPVQGFYIGSLIATELNEKNRKQGLLFSDRPEPSRHFAVYNNNRSLFEMMLGASHGSADGYIPESVANLQGEQTPGRQIYAQKSDGRCRVSVMVLDLPEERHLFERLIRPLQQRFIAAAAACTWQFLLNGCRRPDDQWFARRHARMVFRPTQREVSFYEKLYHLENFGVFEYTTFRGSNRVTWKQRWANFKGVLLHPEVLESGIWPPVILRKMGVAPLRYYDGWRRSVKEFGLRW